jgi:hypothetical protein
MQQSSKFKLLMSISCGFLPGLTQGSAPKPELSCGVSLEHHHDSHANEHNHGPLTMNISYTIMEPNDADGHRDSGLSIGGHYMVPLEVKLFEMPTAFAIGGHYVFMDAPHYSAMLGIMVAPSSKWSIGLMPAVSWSKHAHEEHSMQMGPALPVMPENKWQSEFGVHLEVAYALNLWGQQFTPTLGFMEGETHRSYSLGAHFSF